MKARLPMIWLAVLTIYQSYLTTDGLQVLRSVEANQEFTLQYMERAVTILKKLRKAHETVQPVVGMLPG